MQLSPFGAVAIAAQRGRSWEEAWSIMVRRHRRHRRTANMGEYSFEREARTPYSEAFTIESDDGADVGRVDLHYTPTITYATLCVGESLTEDDIQELIGQIDERLVMTSDPYR